MAMQMETIMVHNETTGEKGIVVEVRRPLPEACPSKPGMFLSGQRFVSVLVNVECAGSRTLKEWPASDGIVVYL